MGQGMQTSNRADLERGGLSQFDPVVAMRSSLVARGARGAKRRD
jgi:hypothetical protein